MKVVHLCIACFFPDGYSYQENMLPKYHKALEYDVEVIASLETFNEQGRLSYLPKASTYNNEYGIKVTRLNYLKDNRLCKKLKKYVGLYESLENATPDILFIHGCQSCDMSIVCKYLKSHKNVRVYVDNHADLSNSATNWLSKNILHKILWKNCAQVIEPYTTKFYGVLPARVDFLEDIYKLPAEKCELLVMGADDERVKQAALPQVGQCIREKYGIKENDFLIMTGGKIDLFKTQTLLMMEAVRNIKYKNVKLIVFGSVIPELQAKINELCDGTKVQYIGWVQSNESYDYFAAADLVVFPGRHSVFWEQVVGQGIPMICKYWDGTTHVDLGGNVKLLYHDSVDEIQKVLEEIIDDPNQYEQMRSVAQEKGMKVFSYKEIAKKSIGGYE